MRLYRAARAFDKTPCADAYTGKQLFMAQLGLYDDTKRDSEAGERRILSTAPGITIPPRRVVSAAGTRFILGHDNPDTFNGQVHRVGWVAHEATDLVQVRTLAQVCSALPGAHAWAGHAWIKNLADNQHSSDVTGEYHFHFAQGEPLEVGRVLSYGNRVMLVRAVRQGPAGTLIAVSDDMGSASITTASVTSGTWNPLTETWTGANVVTPVLRARWQSLYEYRLNAAPKFGPADLQIVLSDAVDVKVGAKVTLDDGRWQIESMLTEDGVRMCRAVRHA